MHLLLTTSLLISLASCGLDTDQFSTNATSKNMRSSGDANKLSREGEAVVVLFKAAIKSDEAALNLTVDGSSSVSASAKQITVFEKSIRKGVSAQGLQKSANVDELLLAIHNTSVPASEDAGLDLSMDLLTRFFGILSDHGNLTDEQLQAALSTNLKASGFDGNDINDLVASLMKRSGEDDIGSIPQTLAGAAAQLGLPIDKFLEAMANNMPQDRSDEFISKAMDATLKVIKEKNLSGKKVNELYDAFSNSSTASDDAVASFLAEIKNYAAEREAEKPSFLSNAADGAVDLLDRLSSLFKNVGLSREPDGPVVTYPISILRFSVGIEGAADPADGTFTKDDELTVSECEVVPSLPIGLEIDDNCKISGIPLAPFAETAFTITVTDSAGQKATDTISITVAGSTPLLAYTTSNLSLTAGVGMTDLDPADGALTAGLNATIASWAISPDLPNGMTFDTETGIISGTPSGAASSSHVVTMTNSHGVSASHAIDILVEANSPVVNYTETSVTLIQNVAMTPLTPATKTNGISATANTCMMNPTVPGLSIDDTTCVISGTPTAAAAAVDVTITHTNSLSETATATIEIIVASVPTLTYAVSTQILPQNGSMSLTPNALAAGDAATVQSCAMSTSISGLNIGNTDCVISGTPDTPTANATVTITVTNSFNQTDTFDIAFTVTGAPTLTYGVTSSVLALNSAMSSLTPSALNAGAEASVQSCAMSPAVSGVSIDNLTCVISGTPDTSAAAATSTITLTNNSGQTDTFDIDFTVAGAPTLTYGVTDQTLVQNNAMSSITPSSLGAGTNGSVQSCSMNPSISGVSIDNSTCVISGTPDTTAAATTVTITLTNNASETDTFDIDFTVAGPPTLAYGVTSQILTEDSLMTSITPSSLSAGAQASVQSCAMNPSISGVSIDNSTCVISGTPDTAADESTVTITLTNDASETATFDIDFTVVDVPTIAYGVTDQILPVNAAMSDITPSFLSAGNNASVQSCSMNPSISGVSIDNSTCVISGTPDTATATTTVTITLTNDDSQTDTFDIDFTVTGAPTLTYGVTDEVLAVDTLMSSITPSALNAGAEASVQSCLMSPTISGVSIDNATCVISGTPDTTAAAATSTITLTNNAGQTDTFDIDFTVAGAPTLTYGAATSILPVNTVMTNITPSSLSAGTNGSVQSCSMNPSISGVSIDNSTCVISGTPDTPMDSTTVTVTLTSDASQTETFDIDFKVVATPSLAYGVSAQALIQNAAMTSVTPTTIDAGTYSSSQTCTMNPAISGVSISYSCVISGTPDTAASATTSTITLTNEANATATYDIDFTVQGVPAISYANASLTLNVDAAMTAENPTAGTFNAGDNGASVSNCTVAPPLPDGLALNSSTCVISGTPTSTSTQTTYTITLTNNFSLQAAADIDITVSAASNPTLVYNSASISGIVGAAITDEVPGTTGTLDAGAGATITDCTISPPLPNGLFIDSSDCSIYGIATETHSNQTHTVTITNSFNNTDTDTIDIFIDGSSPSLAYGSATINAVVGVAITDESPINTGTFNPGADATITDCAIDIPLPQGLYFDTDYCDIYGLPEETLGTTTFTVTLTNSFGKTAQDTIDIFIDGSSPSLAYGSATINAVVGVAITDESPINTGTYDPGDYATITGCAIDQALPQGLYFDTDYCDIYGMPEETLGTTTFTVTLTNSFGKTAQDTIDIFIDGSSPSLTYGSAQISAVVGVAITDESPINTGTYDPGEYATITGCAIDQALPQGLYFDTDYCDIYGMPETNLGTTTYTVTLTNSFGKTAQDTIDIFVDGSSPSLAYGSASINATSGQAITDEQPTSTGTYDAGEYATITSCAIDQPLPNGMSFDTTYCDIYGTPTEGLSLTTFTVTLTNSFGKTAQDTIDIAVTGAQPTLIYSSDLIQVTVNDLIDEDPSTTGTLDFGNGATDDTCTVSPPLPSSLTLTNYTCAIYGYPSDVLARTTYTVTVTNDQGGTDTDTIDIEVLAPVPTITFDNASETFAIGDYPSFYPTVDDGEGSSWLSNCTVTPTFPTGITINSTYCSIDADPQALLDQTYTITGTNSYGETGQTTLRLIATGSTPSLTFADINERVDNGFEGWYYDTLDAGEYATVASCTISPDLPEGMTFGYHVGYDKHCSFLTEPNEGTEGPVTYTVTLTNNFGVSTTETFDMNLSGFTFDDSSDFSDNSGNYYGIDTTQPDLRPSKDVDCNYNSADGSTPFNCNTMAPWWAPKQDNIVSYMDFDDGYDEVGAASFSTDFDSNAPTTTSMRKIGKGSLDLTASSFSAPFYGSDSRHDIGAGDFSMSLWFYPIYQGSSSMRPIWSYKPSSTGDDLTIGYKPYNSDLAVLTTYDGSTVSLTEYQFPYAQWNHIVIVKESSVITYYVNGLDFGSHANTSDFSDNFDNYDYMWFGSTHSGGTATGDYANGYLDEFVFWDAALSSDDVTLIYDRQRAVSAAMYDTYQTSLYNSQIVEWSKLEWSTPLPFGKPLLGDADGDGDPENDDETASAYSSLVGVGGATSAANNDLQTGLIAYFPMDGTVGAISNGSTVPDQSGNGYDLTSSGDGVAYAPGIFGQAVQLDGSSDHLEISNHFGDPSTVTISAWFNGTNTGGGEHKVITLGDSANIGIATDYVEGAYKNSSSWQVWRDNAAITRGAGWQHVVLVLDPSSSSQKIYVNGTETASATHSGTIDYFHSQSTIGARAQGGYADQFFRGLIDEVAIWNRALHATEISQLYRRGANRVLVQVRACPQGGNCYDGNYTNRFFGPNGDPGSDYSNSSWFSEMHNSSGNAPKITFTDWTGYNNLSSTLKESEKFVFRVFLESDDPSTVPNVTSTTIWP